VNASAVQSRELHTAHY